jgi:hypothetical protein
MVSLLIVILLYIVGGYLLPSWFLMGAAFVVLSIGFGLAISFSVKNNGSKTGTGAT